MKVHVITQMTHEGKAHPCGKVQPPLASEDIDDVTCALCLAWAVDQQRKGNL